jgi:hypothetical protein
MTYAQSPTERPEIVLSIVRILLPLGVLVALWLLAPAVASAVEGTGGALDDPVESTTDAVVTTTDTVTGDTGGGDTGGQGTVDSTGGEATDTAGSTGGEATDTAGSTGGEATDTAGKTTGAVTDTAGSTGGAATDTAGSTGGAATDTAGSTAGAATAAAGKATGAVTGAVADTVDSTAGAATDAAGGATGAVADTVDSVADTVDSTAGAATDAAGRATGAVGDTVDSTFETVMETAKPLAAPIAPTLGDAVGDVVDVMSDVVGTLGQYATGGLDRTTGSTGQLLEEATRLLENETTFLFRSVDDAPVIFVDPVLGAVGDTVEDGIVEQVIRSVDSVTEVSTRSQRDTDSDVDPTGSTVVDSGGTTQPSSDPVDLEKAIRDLPIARLAETPLAPVTATSGTSTDVPASDAPSSPRGEPVPIAPVPPEDAIPTGTAARDTQRGGSSTQDLAALAAAIFIALALVRWSRREAELRYSPVFLSLAERPG